jgi:uncharacterized protein (DUF1697 family)
MPRYAAFLRGVSPMNCRMADLQKTLESAGFTGVKTFLSSGNAAFDSRTASPKSLERKIETALQRELGKTFMTLVHPIEELRKVLASDPYRATRLPADAKRIVTFLRAAPKALELPVEKDGARLVRLEKGMLFGAYVRSDKGPVFMALIEKAAGKEQTTRTWQTLERVVKG